MIRILSDLHWGHKASLIKDPRSLDGLFEEPDQIIFNGDTLEQKYEDSPTHLKHPLPSIDQLRASLVEMGTTPHFITGNHDPKISPYHYGELNQGAVIITHGDGIFQDIAPWSQNASLLAEVAAERQHRRRESGNLSFYGFLQSMKEACIEEHERLKDYDPTVWGKFQIFLRQAWPPTRVLKILECWQAAPQKAVEMVRRFSLSPEFIIIGHTHHPTIRQIDGTTVINTGSFFPWPGATIVDLHPHGLSVKKIVRRGSAFAVGNTIGEFEHKLDLRSLTFPTEGIPDEIPNEVKPRSVSH